MCGKSSGATLTSLDLRALTLAGLWLVATAAVAADFDKDFTGATLRIDYYHTGTATEEHMALDRARIEGPWPGSRTQLIDTTNLGKYLVEVADLDTNRVIYTRGFASIYGEWETTSEAHDGTWRVFAEAVRIPEPRRRFQLRLRKRESGEGFREIWNLGIDPGSRFVDRAPLPEGSTVKVLFEHGPPHAKVDLVVLGDGYTVDEIDTFERKAAELIQAMFEVQPFRRRKKDFNVRLVRTPASASGITRPRAGQFRPTPLRARYNTFDSERYVLTLDDRAWRDAAAAAPYDFVLILVNERKYGGGGIYRLYSTAAADSAFAAYLVIHEFGHHFAGLGDEYYTSSVAYESAVGEHPEPWEPNVAADIDAARLKWRALVAEGTPLPTPWSKEEYERRSLDFQQQRRELRSAGAAEEALESLFREERATFTTMLGEERYAGSVGAFEGAMYEAQGLYRPAVDCIMFTRDEVGFCPVCQRAVERAIDQYSR